ncbi:MAG TPA: hypothetical protein VN903_36000 [Polyangia bacterium]|nr:hypothetical protein [Polyangia bacterium]
MRLAILLALLAIAAPAHADKTITTPGTLLRDTTITGDLNLKGAHGAVISNVTVTGSFACLHSNDVVLQNVTILGQRFCLNKWDLSASHGFIGRHIVAEHLGEGVTDGDHILLWFCDDGTILTDCSFKVTHNNPSTDATHCEYHFSSYNRIERRNRTVYVMNQPDAKTWRWRNTVDKGLPPEAQYGCFNNLFDHCSWTATGPGAATSRWCPSSSSTCDGSVPSCVGHWNSTMIGCEFHMDGGTMEWQGGFQGWHIDSTLFDGNVVAYDVHRDTLRWCKVTGKWSWTDQYQRPLWKPGDVQLWGNTFAGGVSVAPTLAAVPGAMVTSRPAADTWPPNAIVDAFDGAPVGPWQRLWFKAPGDDVDGTARVARYLVTLARTNNVTAESTVRAFAQPDTLASTPAPRAPGARDTVWFRVPTDAQWRVARVYAVDAAGNRSFGSNRVGVLGALPGWAVGAVGAGASLVAAAAYALVRRRQTTVVDG